MRIKKITIKYIKGIEHKIFPLDLIPNKPNIFVAPNGFGKSSITTAFKALNKKRINLTEKEDFYKNDDKNNNNSEIKILIENNDKSTEEPIATNKKNEIDKFFDVFVINNSILAKSKGGYYGAGRSSLNISSIILKNTIPKKSIFNYKYSEEKKKFGKNGKILFNLDNILKKEQLIIDIFSDNDFKKLDNKTNQKKIKSWIDKINLLTGNEKQIKDNIDCTIINDVFNNLRKNIQKHLTGKSKTDNNLLIYQIHKLSLENKAKIQNILKYKKYLIFKKKVNKLLLSLGNTWKKIKPKETKGKLILEFPDIRNISNGERDSISFLAKLLSIEEKIGNKSVILVIDEIFDYLDDANLVICQFYITKFIKSCKQNNNEIFPIIMTHLNPFYFRNYTFSKQKVYFLNKQNTKINKDISKIIENRDEETIKDNIDKYFIHFHNEDCDISSEFEKLSLKKDLGNKDNFLKHIKKQFEIYIENKKGYDPLSICTYLRIKIEKYYYNKLATDIDKNEFLNTHKTKKKLLFSEEKGIYVHEIHYLLGIIYNDGLHINNSTDWVSPLRTKLDNLIIKNMIKEAIEINTK